MRNPGSPKHALPLVRFLRMRWQRYASRQALARMDDTALRDLGLSRADAENEANKPFWR